MITGVAGAVVECGVFKGASFIRWVKFRELLSNDATQKIIGFDVFGKFPEATLEKDIKHLEKYLEDAGEQGISVDQLKEVLNHYNLGSSYEFVGTNEF